MTFQQRFETLDRLGVAALVPGDEREVVGRCQLLGLQPEALPEPRGGLGEMPLHV